MNASARTGAFALRPTNMAVGRFLAGTVAGAVLLGAAALTALCLLGALAPGWTATVVGSGSMAPGLAVGDVALVHRSNPGDPALVEPGAVVLVQRPGRVPLLHRVLERRGELIVTKGDANEAADSDLVEPADVIGVACILIPWVGLPSLWFGSGNLAAFAASASVIGVLGWVARFGWQDRFDPWRRIVVEAEVPSVADPITGVGAPSTATGLTDGSRSSVGRTQRHPLTRTATLVRVSVLVGVVLLIAVTTRVDTGFVGHTTYDAPSIRSAVLAPPTGLTARACEGAGGGPTLTWTASTSDFVTGYQIVRGGDVIASVDTSSLTWTGDEAAGVGTEYGVRSISKVWTSTVATAALQHTAC